MQAVILAAGRGQRLAPLTDKIPKCLVPIDNEPLLSHQIKALRKWGIKKMYVVVGSHKEKVQEFLKGQSGIQIVENPNFATTNIITSFSCALSAVDSADDVVVIAGDVLFEDSIIGGLLAKEGDLILCVTKKQCSEEEVKVFIEGSRILKLGKKLDPESAYGEFLGVFKAGRKALKDIREIVDQMMVSKQVQGYLFDMINRLIQEKKKLVRAFDIGKALWEDIDIWEDVQRVTEKLQRKKQPVLVKK